MTVKDSTSWSTTSRRIGSRLVVAVLILCGLAAPAAAADQVPFTATGTAVITDVTHLPGGLTQVDFSTSGTATHLGNFTGPLTRIQNHQGNFGSPIHDLIRIAVLGECGRELFVEKRRMIRPVETLEIVVSGKPVRAGIDSYHELIDAHPGDNVRSPPSWALPGSGAGRRTGPVPPHRRASSPLAGGRSRSLQ